MTTASAAISQHFQPVTSHVRSEAPSRAALWGGRVASGLAALFLAFDGGFKLLAAETAAKHSADLGWSGEAIRTLGILQAVCLVAYLVPRTRVLGALLWTGYLGGAVATHLRVGHPLLSHTLFPIYIAALLWLGLWLRDARLRALLPLSR
ncbi:DoxX family protein [Sorangium sp. So ce1504]|uniref:DoxX family protein n=1 Tax=Sorangium sp. So ce1504 TaxID=3133337 RepID=UPI003F637599